MEEKIKTEENKLNTSSYYMTAPYIPFKTLLTAIASFSQALPTRLDRTAWPTFSGLTQSQTLSAFKFLGLIDLDGYVRSILKQLVDEKLESPKFKAILADILKIKYDKVIALARQNGTIAQLQETMRGYNVNGTTCTRAIRFWTEAAKFSGITYPENWKKARGSSLTIKRRISFFEGDNLQQPLSNKTSDIKTISSHGYTKTLTLQGGTGKVTLSVSINPIELSGKTRTWFYELIDKLNECPVE